MLMFQFAFLSKSLTKSISVPSSSTASSSNLTTSDTPDNIERNSKGVLLSAAYYQRPPSTKIVSAGVFCHAKFVFLTLLFAHRPSTTTCKHNTQSGIRRGLSSIECCMVNAQIIRMISAMSDSIFVGVSHFVLGAIKIAVPFTTQSTLDTTTCQMLMESSLRRGDANLMQ